MALSKIVLSDGVTELANVKSVTYKEVVNAGVGLRPGCVGSAQIEVEVYGNQAGAVAAGEVVSYYQIDAGGNETLVGLFTAEPSIKTKNSYKFLAYDNAQKLDADFSQWLQAHQEDFPMTVYALVSAACTVAGVTLGSASWPLSTQTVNAFYSDGVTCRDILSYAAEIACKFAHCHTDGAVYFDWYASVTDSIAPSAGTNQYAYKQNGLTYANYTAESLARVAVHPSGEDDVAYIYPDGVTSGNTLHINNNLLLTAADAAFYNAVAQNVYSNLSTLFPYRPFSVNLFPLENPFRAGDIVAVTDIQGVTFSAPVMALSVSASASTLASTGNALLDDATNTQKAIAQLASDIVRINKLKVDWADITEAIIQTLVANDITARNLTIINDNEDVIASFQDVIILGKESDVHAEIDFNSFELYDKGGESYLSIGDIREATGEAEYTYQVTADGSTTQFIFYPVAKSTSSVKVYVNNSQVTSGITVTTSAVTFATAPAYRSVVAIKYTTAKPVYHYDLGTRDSGQKGYFSFAAGQYIIASGGFSSASGGYNNRATGEYSHIGGGRENQAGGGLSSVGGGDNNKATGGGSTVSGGVSNTASGDYADVGGGMNNIASGQSSCIPGGVYNRATHRGQMVFGTYNALDPSTAAATNKGTYVEIVGNGTSTSNRSNARTLDWDGNEVLAGGLKINGTRDIGAELDGLKFRNATPATAGPIETVCPFEGASKLSMYFVNSGGISDQPISGTNATAFVFCFGGSANNHVHILVYTSTSGIIGRMFMHTMRGGSTETWKEITMS